MSEAALDQWWASVKPSLIEALKTRQSSDTGTHPIDYHGTTVGTYHLDIEGENQIVTLKPAEPLEGDGALKWLYDKIKELGYSHKTTGEAIEVYMAKGDKWGDVLKSAAWAFSKLGSDRS